MRIDSDPTGSHFTDSRALIRHVGHLGHLGRLVIETCEILILGHEGTGVH